MIPVDLRVFVYAKPADLRSAYDGLARIVKAKIGDNPRSGDVYVFINKRRNRVKALTFDGTGFCILQKRLEDAKFMAPWKRSTFVLTMTLEEFSTLFRGQTQKAIGHKDRAKRFLSMR